MEFIQEGTTKRYKGYKNSIFKKYLPTDDDICQYGCEFEFYVDKKIVYQTTVDEICKELYGLTSADILVDTVGIPTVSDKDKCLQIKQDISLLEHGLEISIPISSKDGMEHFIKSICSIIDKYGYTNEDTGFHIHISTIKRDGINFNFYKYMLLCDSIGLLSLWTPRVGYSQNIMDILSYFDKQKSRKIKNKKGTIWNLEKIANNHVEIKTIGGKDYHVDADRLIKEFHSYADCFAETLERDNPKHKKMYQKHKEMVSKLDKDIKRSFVLALKETGILPEEK